LKFLPTPRTEARIDTSVSRGTEMAGTVLVFLLVGLALDTWLGTTPAFMIGLVVFSVVGQFVRTWYVYRDEMDRLQRERAEAREGRPR
jgi:F0F1-type ATP synthase assembly protein I